MQRVCVSAVAPSALSQPRQVNFHTHDNPNYTANTTQPSREISCNLLVCGSRLPQTTSTWTTHLPCICLNLGRHSPWLHHHTRTTTPPLSPHHTPPTHSYLNLRSVDNPRCQRPHQLSNAARPRCFPSHQQLPPPTLSAKPRFLPSTTDAHLPSRARRVWTPCRSSPALARRRRSRASPR